MEPWGQSQAGPASGIDKEQMQLRMQKMAQQMQMDKGQRTTIQLLEWLPPADKKMTVSGIGYRHKMLLCQKMTHNMA
jgi:hypothetical protein